MLILDDLSNKLLVEALFQVALNDNKKQVHLILTSTNIQMNELMLSKVESKTSNVSVFLYPTNRKIEKHLILIQHVTKHSEYNFCFFDLQNELNERFISPLTTYGISCVSSQSNHLILKIKSKLFIDKVVKENRVNELRKVFVRKVA